MPGPPFTPNDAFRFPKASWLTASLARRASEERDEKLTPGTRLPPYRSERDTLWYGLFLALV
jgi:hypothetical protein